LLTQNGQLQITPTLATNQKAQNWAEFEWQLDEAANRLTGQPAKQTDTKGKSVHFRSVGRCRFSGTFRFVLLSCRSTHNHSPASGGRVSDVTYICLLLPP